MFVSSQVSLGIEPRLLLSWAIIPRYWQQGYSLMVFHSTSGFSPEKYPDDLNRHGQLIIETNQDAMRDVRPPEGTHYYTFLLHKKSFLGLAEKMSILRFSETIPSAKVAIGRIRDKLDLEDMRRKHELAEIEHESNVIDAELRRMHSRRKFAEATDPSLQKRSGAGAIIENELADIDAIVETLFAKRTRVAELKRDPRFRKLSRHEKQIVLTRIEERLDAAEITARREMRGG
jgi:hypothetical protein